MGLELFPGESSGYNSSASSVTGGDQSPCWNESGVTRRYDVEARMNPSKLKASPFKPKSSSGHRDRLMAVNTPKVPQLLSFQNSQAVNSPGKPGGRDVVHRPAPHKVVDQSPNTTIIKLSEEGTIINNTLIPNVQPPMKVPNKRTGGTLVRVGSMDNGIEYCEERSDQRTVVVEVHRGEPVAQRSVSIPPPPPLFAGGSRGDAATTATPAVPSIADEIKRRAEVIRGWEGMKSCNKK